VRHCVSLAHTLDLGAHRGDQVLPDEREFFSNRGQFLSILNSAQAEADERCDYDGKNGDH
jgi:hypothetical protein